MPAASLDIVIEQGATFSRTLTFADQSNARLDLTNNTFSGMVRKNLSDPSPVATFTCTVLDQTQDATKGQVEIILLAADTLAIPVRPQRLPQKCLEAFCYDIDRTLPDGVTVERVLEGIAMLSPAVTHP